MINVARAERGMEKKTASGRAHAAEENQDHEGGQKQPDGAFVHQRLDGRLHKHAIGRTRHVLTSCFGEVDQFGERFPHSVDDSDGVGISALLEDGNVDRSLAVDADDVGLNCCASTGRADIGDADGT